MDSIKDSVHHVMTSTPMRVSFAGGGTDIKSVYSQVGGAVLSTTINKRIYVTVKKLNQFYKGDYRLNYSKTEITSTIDEIENDIIRECLRLVPVAPPLYISVIADIPAASGLGSSASFAVGLLSALHELTGTRVSHSQLAEEAAHIEIGMLKRAVGKQDQYAASYGGLNFITFNLEGQVSISSPTVSATYMNMFFDHIMMFWTGITRDANDVLSKQCRQIDAKLETYVAMKEQAQQLYDILNAGVDMSEIGNLLHEGWLRKKTLEADISSSEIDKWYQVGLANGAYGGKLCGAGGGGFLLFIAPPEAHEKIAVALPLAQMPISYEPSGVQTLLPVGI